MDLACVHGLMQQWCCVSVAECYVVWCNHWMLYFQWCWCAEYVSTVYGLLQNPPRWIVYHELVLTSKEYARTVTEIRPDWLLEIAPHMYSSKDIAADLNKKMPKSQGRAAMDA